MQGVCFSEAHQVASVHSHLPLVCFSGVEFQWNVEALLLVGRDSGVYGSTRLTVHIYILYNCKLTHVLQPQLRILYYLFYAP